MKFLACSECGGSEASTPTNPVICSDRYLSAATSAALKLLGVAAGGRCPTYLAGTTLGGLVFIDGDGVATVTRAPLMTLPPATDDEFTHLMVASPGADANTKPWEMFAAVEDASMLTCEAGTWRLRLIGNMPGIDTLGEVGAFDAPLVIIGIQETAPNVWTAKKLTAVQNRVIVGLADNLFRCLANNEYLIHPLANLGELRCDYFYHNDGGGAPIAGGIALGTASDDNLLAVFNIATKRFLRAPARVAEEVAAETQVHIVEGGAWVSLDPHCIVTATFNYPNAMVIATIRNSLVNNSDPPVANDFSVDFGLFIDGAGAPEKIWDVKGTRDNTMHFLLEGLDYGEHTIEIKGRRNAVDMQNLYTELSNMSVFSLP